MNFDSKIYIAGHTGLVGSALWKRLTDKGYTHLIGKHFSELDLTDQKAVAEFFAAEKPEYVFLAAAKVGGIMANNTYRAEFIYENLMIQNNVIHQSYLNGVKKLLFLGSTCIYPKECPQPMKEEYLLTGPLEYTNEPYAVAKIAGMKMTENYNIQYGTDYMSVMPTNLYGPNDNFDLDKSHVLPAMIRKIHLARMLEMGDWGGIGEDLRKVEKGEKVEKVEKGEKVEKVEKGEEGEKVEKVEEVEKVLERYGISRSGDIVTVSLWGTGKPMREFLWSEEMADACVYVMEQAVIDVSTPFINIGSGREISIHDLAHLIKRVIGFEGKIIFDSSKPDGTMRKLTDVTRLHDLGWHHKIEIEEGVRKLYDWYCKT